MSRNAVLSLLLLASTLLAQPLSPTDAVAKMKLPDGFSVRCVASEPMIRQPLSISFDGTGRLWVLQYLQYPNPEGLKPVKQDQYLRTTWDKVLDPPPKGPKGLDKITICYDPDEHGVFRKSKDFLTGLNLASGFCLANDGVYVLQAPYLLFYPDKNHDDVPDGDPEVLVKGFGLDDTHSLANSLQFGPDGWLYGAAGSTSTSKITDPSGVIKTPIEFQQGVWRYHPKSKRFELFSEGGGNTYGLDFDATGQCITGTNWGGFACLHQLPGAYYVKGFSKHGPLHNPHAYGYFDHVPYKNFKGGHVTCGGIIYDADTYPKEFRGQYIAGNLLSNAVYTHKLTPKGASFTAEHGVDLLIANDDQFRPVDLQLGPDGCVYVADWYDKRAAHLDPIDNWDKSNGRVYKIEYTGAKPLKPFDIRKKSSAELVELLKHPNIWWRRAARQQLEATRPTNGDLDILRAVAEQQSGPIALEAFWSLATSADPDHQPDLSKLLEHKSPHVRAWAVRLNLEDRSHFNPTQWDWVCDWLKQEADPVVQAQLLCSVRRMGPTHGGQMLVDLMDCKGIDAESSARLLLWWAYQSVFTLDEQWAGPVVLYNTKLADDTKQFLIERCVQRAASAEYPHTAELSRAGAFGMSVLPEPFRGAALRGMEVAASSGVAIDRKLLARNLQLVSEGKISPSSREAIMRILATVGDDDAISLVKVNASDPNPVADRVKWVTVLGRVRDEKIKASVGEWLVAQLPDLKSDDLRLPFLGAIESTASIGTGSALLGLYPKWSAVVKKRAVQVLLSRKEWSSELFKQLDAGKFPKADVSVEQARAAVAFNDTELTALVEKHFGKLSTTAGEKQARIASLNTMLGRAGAGDAAKGKAIFTKSCGACHQLFGEGGKVGPDLTTADRKNRGSLLASVVDPSGYIRPEFVTQAVNMLDGRTLSGVISAQSADAITLATYTNNKVEPVTLLRKGIDKQIASGVSLMPEKMLDTMTEPEIRNLFAYLMMATPGSDAGGGEKPKDPLTPSPSPAGGEGGKEKKKLKLALISGADEYQSNEVLPVLQKRLEEKSPVECVQIFFTEKDTDFSKIEKLKECDAAVFFTRRLKIGDDQLKTVKAYCESGKPVIGIRTASHGFQTWLEMDGIVYGGNYKNHYKAGDRWELKTTPEGEKHPILKGVKVWASEASLYRNTGAAKDITVLMTGGGKEGSEPVTWTREREVGEKKVKQRIFYTSLGHQKDFEEENFLKLLVNGIAWATQDERIGK